MTTQPDRLERIRGCLLGGAVGDALGAPVEFMSTDQIRAVFGLEGIQEFAPAYGRLGAVTDDTQLTLFTAEGLIRAEVRLRGRGICNTSSVIHHALLRWLYTQGHRNPALYAEPDGWLVQRKELFALRAPGMTCLASLKAATRFGEEARNDSKGCGAIMRIAPVGLVTDAQEPLAETYAAPAAYTLGCESARSTHGHPMSTFSSGFFALLIAQLMKGASLRAAITESKRPLQQDGVTDLLAVIQAAERLAESDAPSTPELIEQLGGGWVAEEALAIALFCALRAQSFEHGVRLAVNHSGDSDSTGSLTGQLLGALSGATAIPKHWLDEVELRDIIEALSTDLVAASEHAESPGGRDYPGW